jgi:prevent-host-death family protein
MAAFRVTIDGGYPAPLGEAAQSLSRTRGFMTIMMVMTETLPLAEIKAHLSEIVDRVEREHERIVLTRNGRPAAVIMSPADLEALEDTLELLSDAAAMAEIEFARAEVATGRVVTAEELRAKYLHK